MHQLTIVNLGHFDWIIGPTQSFEFEALEEPVDHSDLLGSNAWIIVIGVENNSHGTCEETILLLVWQMDGVHLEVKTLTIDCMLRE